MTPVSLLSLPEILPCFRQSIGARRHLWGKPTWVAYRPTVPQPCRGQLPWLLRGVPPQRPRGLPWLTILLLLLVEVLETLNRPLCGPIRLRVPHQRSSPSDPVVSQELIEFCGDQVRFPVTAEYNWPSCSIPEVSQIADNGSRGGGKEEPEHLCIS